LIAALFLGIFISASSGIDEARAFSISNCSGSPIAVTAIPVDRGQRSNTASARLRPGASGNIPGNASLVDLKVYESDLVQTLRISVSKLNNSGSYSTIRMASGHWQLVEGKAC